MEEQVLKFLNKVFMLAGVLVVGVLVFFVGEILLQNKSINQQSNFQITVSGQGKVYAKPDVAVVSLGVTTQAKTVADVTKSNTDKMNAVIEAVKKLGVEDKDIETTNYSLNPVYDSYAVPVSASSSVPVIYPVRTGTTLTGYKLDQNVQVKIRDFTKIGDVLSMATENGANVVGDLQFSIEDAEQFKTQARAEAIKQAKEKATILAQQTGINLGDIINVYEDSYGYSPIAYSSAKVMTATDGGGSEIAQVESGEQTVTVTVNLTYKVK